MSRALGPGHCRFRIVRALTVGVGVAFGIEYLVSARFITTSLIIALKISIFEEAWLSRCDGLAGTRSPRLHTPFRPQVRLHRAHLGRVSRGHLPAHFASERVKCWL